MSDRLPRVGTVQRGMMLGGIGAERRRQRGVGKAAGCGEFSETAVGIGEVRHTQLEVRLRKYYLKNYSDPAGYDIGQQALGSRLIGRG